MSEYDVMVDLETLGISPTSAIIQIGACTLDERHTFLASVDREYYEEMHRDRDFRYTYDDATVEWWDQQEDAAKESLNLALYPSPGGALVAFTSWYMGVTRQEEDPKIWANSPAFDLVILQHAYRVEKFYFPDLAPPWSFWQERCYRTFNSEFGHMIPRDWPSDLIKHRADHDALYQARRLKQIMDRIRVE